MLSKWRLMNNTHGSFFGTFCDHIEEKNGQVGENLKNGQKSEQIGKKL